MAGEEVVGGVVGFLRMDIGDFERDMLKALALVKALDGTEVNIKVDADGVERAGRSAATATKTFDSMGAASRRLTDATGAVKVAELRLDEVRNKSNATSSQHLTAMQALQKAHRAEQDAVFASYEGNILFGKSNDVVAKSARTAARDVDGMGQSFEGLRDPRLIVGALGAGMALLGPVTGAATAAVGGLVGIVGTAALAFVGFKKEVEGGTALGVTLQGALKGVGAEFTSLGATASHAMAGDVLDGLREVRDFLPTVDNQVAGLAGHLGRAFNTSAKGTISALNTMMPLLEDGGRYVEVLANKFAAFAASQEFADFVAYARRELPNVTAALGDVVKGVIDMGVALAPVGDQLVTIIDLAGKSAQIAAPILALADAANKFTLLNMVDKLRQAKDANDNASNSITSHISNLSLLTAATSPLAAAMGTTDQALNAARDAQIKHAQAAKDATLQMWQENDAAGLLKQQLDKLNGKAISAASAQNAFDSALANSNKHVAANGKTVDRASTSIKGMSAAAVANRSELIRQVQAAEDVAVAMRDNGASTDETRAKMVTMRSEILANAHDHHLNAAAVQAFIDKIYKIPKDIDPTRLEVDSKAGLLAITAFQNAIDTLHGKTVTAGVRYAFEGQRFRGAGRSTAGGSTFATGGVIGSFAKGGAIPGYASGTIVGPGTGTSDSILAAIQGTQEMIRVSNGEFISTAASQRRNRAALEAGNKGAQLTVAGGSEGIDYERLAATIAAQMRHVILNPVVTAGSFDRAMGGSLR